ncbi:MAG: DUF7507 domain-containing protein, partial [Nocardioides sp.]
GLLSAVIASGLAAFATPTRAADGGTQAGTSMLGVTARDDLPPQRWYAYVESGGDLEVHFSADQRTGDGPANARTPVRYQIIVRDAAGTARFNESVNTALEAQNVRIDRTGITGSPGVWTVDFRTFDASGDPAEGYDVNWRISPHTAAGTYRPGRVWVNTFAGSQPSNGADPRTLVDNQRDLRVWWLNRLGVKYASEFYDYNGIVSLLEGNSIGNAKTDCSGPSYQSVNTSGATDGRSCPGAFVFRMFFEAPDATMPATAPAASGTTWVDPVYVPASMSNFTYSFSGSSSKAGTMTWDQSQSGTVTIEIDPTGTGAFTAGTTITTSEQYAAGANTATWDGRNASGVLVLVGTRVHVRYRLDRVGEIHWVSRDVERRAGGHQITQLTGPDTGARSLYWNDRPPQGDPCWVTDNPQTRTGTCDAPNPESLGRVTSPGYVSRTNQGGGVDSTGGRHGWGSTSGLSGTVGTWGNRRSIDEWTFYDDLASLDAVIPPQAGPDLKILKVRTSTTPVAPGEVITWKVSILNDGPAQAAQVTVNDLLPAQVDPATATLTNPSKGTISGLAWNVGTLAPGEQATVTVTATIRGDATGTLRNTATVTNPDDPHDPDVPCEDNTTLPGDIDNCDFVTDPLVAPSLRIDKALKGKVAIAGDGQSGVVTWTIDVRNDGPAVARNVEVDDSLPAGFVAGSVKGVVAKGSFDAATRSWSIGDMSAGEVQRLTLTATYPMSKLTNRIVNGATVTSPDDPYEPGPCQVNTTLDGDTDQCDEVPAVLPDIRINKAKSGKVKLNKAKTKGRATWSIEVGNLGKGKATTVVVTDLFPKGKGFVKGSLRVGKPTKGTFSKSSMKWSVGSLAYREKQRIKLSAVYSVKRLAGQGVINTVTVTSPDDPYKGGPCQVNQSLAGDKDQCDKTQITIPTPPVKIDTGIPSHAGRRIV